ncbi:hypothetical protein [Peribacillus huizhouensis]|uniref:Uncharacterized protein n=1 Tax=Peribacillus huizhouensis TaxID=1501239 RepID=A0ABR6CM68_9BACI|nr:hypothetical protein [Peribacillus huizhouensis]MBA9026122.1 hypothetical protein [Peribacillus huizhouensis]
MDNLVGLYHLHIGIKEMKRLLWELVVLLLDEYNLNTVQFEIQEKVAFLEREAT